jgi:hypothetical protein
LLNDGKESDIMLVICDKRNSKWCVAEECEHYNEHEQFDRCSQTICWGDDGRKHTVKCVPIENKQ